MYVCWYIWVYEYTCIYVCITYVYMYIYFTVDKQTILETYMPIGLELPPVVWETCVELKCRLKYGHIFMCIIYLHIWDNLWYGRHHVTCNIHKIPPNINQTGSDVLFINMKNRKSSILCHSDRWDPDICLMSCNCLTPDTLLSWIPTLMYMYSGGAIICRDLVSLGAEGYELDKPLDKGP